MRHALGAAVALAAATVPAWAQDVRLDTKVSQRTVEQGQSFQVQLTALVTSGQAMPSSPRLPKPPGATVHGPSMATQQQIMMGNGGIERLQGFTATWSVTPQRLGKLRVGPPSVLVGSQQHQGQAVTIEVVAPGQAPSRQRGRPRDPFDLFRGRGSLFPPGLFDDPFDDLDPNPFDNFVPRYPPDFAVSAPSDPIAFLRSRLDKASVVVGEQVTLSIYAYGKPGPFKEFNSKEPQTADFVSFPILEGSRFERIQQVDIGDDIWHALKVRELALFPIRSGKLELGNMQMTFGGYQTRDPKGVVRQSKMLTLNVSEPPLAGRPSGYRIGDVGNYRLNASVEPATVRQGDAVSVSVSLTGKGNLPLKLPVPEQDGVEWLQPQVRGDVGPQAGVVQGSRHFEYVVRLHKAGTIRLGDLRIPFWDPERRAYSTASVKLGSVQVTPNDAASRAAEQQSAKPAVSGALSRRQHLEQAPELAPPLSDEPWFWGLLAFGPLGVAGTGASLELVRRLKQRWSRRRKDKGSLALDSIQEARSDLKAGAFKEAAGKAERALVLALDNATGIKARGLLKPELEQQLQDAGLGAPIIAAIQDLLNRSEMVRFTGEDSPEEAKSIVATSGELVQALGRMRRSKATAES